MKHLLYLLMATALLGFTACSDDDEKNESKAKALLAMTSDNQVYVNNQLYDVTAELAVRSADPSCDDEGAHYLDLYPSNNDFNARFDIGTPLMGVSVDLANPLAAVNGHQLSFSFYDPETYATHYALEVYDATTVVSRIGEEENEGDSYFSEGVMLATHDATGFKLIAYGFMKDGKPVAINVTVPESQIDYWK